MKQTIVGLLFLVGMLAFMPACGEPPVAMSISAPEFDKAGEWINSKPLKLKDLRDQVVVVHFWTFG